MGLRPFFCLKIIDVSIMISKPMKIVIISDTHLSSRVYRKKYYYLKSIIEEADKVIIAGDFWDGFLTNFDKFTRSKWRLLFPLLLEKETVYLFGNHDRAEWCDDRVSLFSVEHGMNITLETPDQTYFITHGHIVFTSMEDRFPVLNHSIPLRLGSSLDVIHKLVWGRRFLRHDSDINQPMADWVAKNLPSPQILVTGHSHYPEIDLKQRFINTGFIGLGYGNYIIIDDNGPRIVRERY